MYDDTLMEHTPWVVLRAAWRGASDEVALAAALRQSEDLEKMVGAAKAIAYMVTLNDDIFDIHQVDEEWIGQKISGWNRSRLTQVAATRAPALRTPSRLNKKM